jgi:hypothetical protein
MTRNTQRRAGGGDHPSSPPAPKPAPGASAPTVPGAEGGRAVLTPASRVVPAGGTEAAGRDGTSREVPREGTAGPAPRVAGPVQTSATTGIAPPVPDPSRRAGQGRPPAPSRNAPAAYPNPGGRGTESSLSERGGSGRARDDGPGGAHADAGSPPATEPGGGERVRTASPSPGTTTPPAGQEFKNAYRKALADQAKAKRNGRGRYPVKRRGDGYLPGSARRMPPGGGA